MEWGSGITYIGETHLKGQLVKFGIKDADRASHLAVVGKAGSGKPALVVNMAVQDILRGRGVLVVDSMGSITQSLLERIPKDARERVIFLDPSDGEYPYSWNPLNDFENAYREGPERALERLAELLAGMYKFNAPKLAEFIASQLLLRTDATLVFFYTLVTDANARNKFLPQASDARTRFEELLEAYPDAAHAIAENGKYLAKDTMMRNILGQQDSKFNFEGLRRDAIIIANLSRIRMFPTRITPLVRLYVSAARLSALEESPTAIYLHDCLRYFSPEEFEKAIFDHSVTLTFSDTSHGEEEKTLRHAALQRAGSVISFLPHETDIHAVERIFYPYVPLEKFEKLEGGEYVIALSIDGVRSRPFFARTLPLPERTGISPRDLELESRRNYAITRLKADALFIPRHDEADKGIKPEDPGSFSNAFRSIFTKRAGASDAPAGKPASFQTIAPPAPQNAPSQPAEKPVAFSPTKSFGVDEKKVPKSQPAEEISEEELKKMLHVGRPPQ